jgi:hypothetical protein
MYLVDTNYKLLIRSREGVFDNTMTINYKIFGAVAGLALASAASAQQAPLASLAGTAAPKEWVRCHGQNGVPMTADAAQSLPMQITGTLACGSEVSVLSDAEGYTVNVSTADGHSGYVASMYLTAVAAPKRAIDKTQTSAMVENNVARWTSGGAGSDQFYSDDSLVESLTVNGVTVQVTLHDTGWKLRANVAVANDSSEQVMITPSSFQLSEFAPAVRTLAYQDPKEMARSVSHGVLWTSESATSSTAFAPQHAGAAATVNVGYKTPFAATQTPNYLVETQSQQLSAAKHDVDLNAVHQIHNTALKQGAVVSGAKSSGAVWFERDKKAEQVVLRIPVGSTIYEFPLSFTHEN